MKKSGLCSVLLFCFAVTAIQASLFPNFPVPTFMWSNKDYFVGNNVQSVETIYTTSVTEFISSFISPLSPSTLASNPLFNLLASSTVKNTGPEIVIVWIETEAELSTQAYTHLKDTIETSSSSVVLPYTYQITPISLSESISGATNIKASELETYLIDNKDLFTNGNTEVLLVHIKKSERVMVREMNDQINTFTSGNFIGMYTADSESLPEETIKSPTLRSGGGEYANGYYWPREIWEGLMVTILLMILMSIGIGCTFQLQVPRRWEDPKKSHNIGAAKPE